MKNYYLLFYVAIQMFLIGMMFEYFLRYDEIHQPKTELPEEFKNITKLDNLRGYFDKDSVLHIEFNNHYMVKPEYILEIDNDSVLIQSDDIIYKCHYRDIQKTIDKDNI